MSGAYSINRPCEYSYDLWRSEEERIEQAKLLRGLYARVEGWDARRLRRLEAERKAA